MIWTDLNLETLRVPGKVEETIEVRPVWYPWVGGIEVGF